MGFVSKKRTRCLLQEKPVGTFLIRFSESILDGAITFSWVEQAAGEKHIRAVEPYTKKELSLLSLPIAIDNYTLTTPGGSHNPLVYLYPDTPKDAVFARYRVAAPSPPSTNIKGYLPKKITLVSIDPTPPASPPSPPSPPALPADVLLTYMDHEPLMVNLDDIIMDLLDEPDVLPESPLQSYSDPGIFFQNINQ